MRDDDPDFLDVIQRTNPFKEGRKEVPDVEIREETETQQRQTLVSNETHTSYRFYVVDNMDGEVLYAGSWTTRTHHNTYAEAKAKAVGFLRGYQYDDAG